MLKQEETREILQNYLVLDWQERSLAQIKKLPSPLPRVAFAMIERDEQGHLVAKNNYESQQIVRESFRQAIGDLGSLDSTERESVFSCFFPKIAQHVEKAWELIATQPYQGSWQRKAFRAPDSAEVALTHQSVWLEHSLNLLGMYQQEISWWATWAAYLATPYGVDSLGILLAAAIEGGGSQGEEVFNILTASAKGEHPTGAMGRHVVRALLIASRPEGWELMGKTLLAAQREEGLRQVILEAIDEAHPLAFRKMLRLILEHDLARFSATTRALNVWLGYLWDSENVKIINVTIASLLALLEEPEACTTAINNGSGEEVYLGLWAVAHNDAFAAIPLASAILKEPDLPRRFAATYLLCQLQLEKADEALLEALGDPDLAVAALALRNFQGYNVRTSKDSNQFEYLEALFARLPTETKSFEPIIWPWLSVSISRETVAEALTRYLAERSPVRLVPYLTYLGTYSRGRLVEQIANLKDWDEQITEAVFRVVTDRSPYVREKAVAALSARSLNISEIQRVEDLLGRKSPDLRRGALSLLLNQPNQAVFVSVGRLLESSNALKRLGGLELLREMTDKKRENVQCRTLAQKFREKQPNPSPEEQKLLTLILETEKEAPSLSNALGLLKAEERTQPLSPRSVVVNLYTPAAIACQVALDQLIYQYRDEAITLNGWNGQEELLLGNMENSWLFPTPNYTIAPTEDAERLPLRQVWEKWWQERPAEMRDQDGLELIRVVLILSAPLGGISQLVGPEFPETISNIMTKLPSQLYSLLGGVLNNAFGELSKVLKAEEAKPAAKNEPLKKLSYPNLVQKIVSWLLRLHPTVKATDLLLDVLEMSFSKINREELYQEAPANQFYQGQRFALQSSWLQMVRSHRTHSPQDWQATHHIRLWRLLVWLGEPVRDLYQLRPLLIDALYAHRHGGATEADLYYLLLASKAASDNNYWSFQELSAVSGRKLSPEYATFTALPEIVQHCRERILEVELSRGDLPSVASQAARQLRYAGGLDTFVKVLAALGQDNLIRGYTYHNLSKAVIFSHLLRGTYPESSDTYDEFSKSVRAAKLSETRLIEAACYAPQWARFVEQTLGWSGFTEGVWWLYAHTKDHTWSVDQDIRDTWQAQVGERTPLSGNDLLEGAVDVAWFWRVYSELGPNRWEKLYEAAKYMSGGGGHQRARLFADAMLGQLDWESLVNRIKQKRHQDAVRALGLLPLPSSETARNADLLRRYQVMQEFTRTGKQFGSQRRASEELATKIGLDNLARGAGYVDPQRLAWAMEAEAVADLAAGPVVATVGEVAVTLLINPAGEPELTISRQGKALKSLPTAQKKEASLLALQERKREITRQASRMRQSLEQAMCRGDEFSGAELANLLTHPILRPQLERLVFISQEAIGYHLSGEMALSSHDGALIPLTTDNVLRIAHPFDLYQSGDWPLWQRECFAATRVQPFKQIFRELYLLTANEQRDGTHSRRYAGHQVQPQKAVALLGQRGWIAHQEEGVRRTFHHQGFTAWLDFLGGYFTPVEVEGLTIEEVNFTQKGDWRPLPLTQIPPLLFSEVMRDLDLVVSVAHRGGIDPEASASTVEMRATLVQETARLLKLENLELKNSHVLIEGRLGRYSIHLGSGIVHQQPGGAVCIIPVHAQHRGRLFLPFADDDPRTAEVISKVLLLARDEEIKDPTILEQLL